MKRTILALLFAAASIHAQEADAGFDLRATISGESVYANELAQAPRSGSAVDAGVRAVLYPTIKLSEHWTIAGALQLISRPYFSEDFDSQGHGIRGQVLLATLGYSRVWDGKSIVIRAGEMPTAFGSFLLRYDDSENPLIGMPPAYGYYYQPISTDGVAAVQADVTLHRWDARVQLANSSPANPRSVFDKDQYRNGVAGFGYTIRQGLRVGVSGYRGPYLYRGYPYFFPGESNPSRLPATAGGADVEWASGHWNAYGEWQRFVLTYHVIPTLREDAGYFELKRTLHPRWFVAARAGYVSSKFSVVQTYEGAVGFRPGTHELLKLGYEAIRSDDSDKVQTAVLFEAVTTVHPFSLAWKN